MADRDRCEYEAVVCDEEGCAIPTGKIHRVVTAPDGESLPGTCPTVLTHGSLFLTLEEAGSVVGRLPCKRCHPLREANHA